jgi:SH3-like domain-containing protein
VRGQRWRAVRGLNGVAGWVLSSQVAVDGEAPSTLIAAEPTPGATGEQVRIANTGGIGVALRNSPRDEDRLPSGLRDGTQVVVVERSGADWARVRSGSGQEGWVPTRYLAAAN